MTQTKSFKLREVMCPGTGQHLKILSLPIRSFYFYYYSNSDVGQSYIYGEWCNLLWFIIDLIPIYMEVYGFCNILM